MTEAATNTSRRAIRLWLYAVAALIFAMVLVGGATRLTESGLSIVEWQPVSGALPPLSLADWQAAFAKYQTIPQYRELNAGMSLDQFKTIYWWEWTHRFLGRFIGAAFLIPFLWFLWRGRVEPGFRAGLWTIFGLGALQGAVGWWMVASGLVNRVSVAHERLAFHLTLACVIYAAILWTARRMVERPEIEAPRRMRLTALSLPVLVLIQLYLGALLAGLRGGLIYNTWPTIEGALVPSAARLFFASPAWRNFFDNVLMVQFEHRTVAYAIFIAVFAHALHVARRLGAGRALYSAWALAGAVSIQLALGILTLLYQVPIVLALCHQGMAIIVLSIAVIHAERLMPRAARKRATLATSREQHS